MIVLRARNVHQIIPKALDTICESSSLRETRNGFALVANEPVTSVYDRPTERVIFHERRDANPFFHLMESLWMLGGRNDVQFVAEYAPNMRNFSDDGKTFHGAYGYRWRTGLGMDQLECIIDTLSENKEDRRCVLQMWDARVDLCRDGKDFPCNLMAVFQIANDGRLDMTVYNRSNDVVWGAYGANAVHFSVLMEYVAAAVGVPVGVYRQVSANLHAYTATVDKLLGADSTSCPYSRMIVETFPLVQPGEPAKITAWNNSLQKFLEAPLNNEKGTYSDPFFYRIAVPMARCWEALKTHEKHDPERYRLAFQELDAMPAGNDWREAATLWVAERRERNSLSPNGENS